MEQKNSKVKKNLAIFDLDGTLFDTSEVNYYAYKQAIEQFGITLDKNYFIQECSGRHYTEFLPAIISDLTLIDIIHEKKKRLYVENLARARENKHLFKIIDSIKDKYHLTIVTTASRRNTMDILTYFGYEDMFEYIVTQEDIIKVKPNPEGFFLVMQYYGISAENTIIFEDSKEGISAAKATGASIYKIVKF